MEQDCWQVWPDRGFLIKPDPVAELASVLEPEFPIAIGDVQGLEALGRDLPELLRTGRVRETLSALPPFDFSPLRTYRPAYGFSVIERLHQLYVFFASAYVHATYAEPATVVPAPIAVPLAALSEIVERPPMLTYSGWPLSGWRRVDPEGPIALDNMMLNQAFTGIEDEAWFILVHTDIEARGAPGLAGLVAARDSAERDDVEGVVAGLEAVAASLREMMRSFGRMTHGCDPDVFYLDVRPYMFSFEGVVFEGVEAHGGAPQHFRGGSGAQSSLVPAFVAGLGLEHERSSLMQHLEVMKSYMPVPHRAFIGEMSASRVRAFVARQGPGSHAAAAYNACLEMLMQFRRAHLHYADIYIFQKVANPLGTGGTEFMPWLKRLIDETERHFIR